MFSLFTNQYFLPIFSSTKLYSLLIAPLYSEPQLTAIFSPAKLFFESVLVWPKDSLFHVP